MAQARARRAAAPRTPRKEFTAERKPRALVVSNKNQEDFEADARAICEQLGYTGEGDWVRDDWGGVTVADAHKQALRTAHEVHQAALNADREAPSAEEVCRRLEVTDDEEVDLVTAWLQTLVDREAAEVSSARDAS